MKRIITTALAASGLVLTLAGCSVPSTAGSDTVASTAVAVPSALVSSAPVPASSQPTAVSTPTKAAKPVPAEYLTALASAQDYNSTEPMSKKGLYKQLTSAYGEKFSKKAGKYAVDHVKADWDKNALSAARTYQSEQHLSTAEIHDQLTSSYGEDYTEAQADYAIKHLNK